MKELMNPTTPLLWCEMVVPAQDVDMRQLWVFTAQIESKMRLVSPQNNIGNMLFTFIRAKTRRAKTP